MENNVRVSRKFVVKHWRDTKSGGYNIKDERGKYELIANMAQRRVRACILEIIPPDFKEAAIEKCREVIMKGDGTPIEDRIRKMLLAFKELGVTQELIEGFLGSSMEAIEPQQLIKLQAMYKSIKDNAASIEELFGKYRKEVREEVKKEGDPAPKKKVSKKATDKLNKNIENLRNQGEKF